MFKNGVKEIAGEYGRAATFMAKWSMDTAGSSCHIHTSLWDAATDAPLMAPADGEDAPSGFSTVGAQWVAGQLHAADQLAWCFAPYVNSYRRYVPDSWAPTAVVWGEDNRTCGFRAVGHGAGRRVESRIPGADVNPYIALAAAIAGGLWGIDHGVELAPAFTGNAYRAPEVPRIPTTLPEAIDQPRVERGGGRGVRARGPPAPGQHRPPGVGQGQLGGHRLGAGPQLRAHLTGGHAGRARLRIPMTGATGDTTHHGPVRPELPERPERPSCPSTWWCSTSARPSSARNGCGRTGPGGWRSPPGSWPRRSTGPSPVDGTTGTRSRPSDPGIDLDRERSAKEAAGLRWAFDADDLYPDAVPCLERLCRAGYRVGIAANQPAAVGPMLQAMGLDVEFVATSATWGVVKPDPEFFERLTGAAGIPPDRIAYVGDRLDQ